LAQFAADLDWAATTGVVVTRATLSQQPGLFVANEAVKAALEAQGTEALPAIVVNGELRSTGTYPDRAALAALISASAVAVPAVDSSPSGDPLPANPSGRAPLALVAAPAAADTPAGGCCGGGGCC